MKCTPFYYHGMPKFHLRGRQFEVSHELIFRLLVPHSHVSSAPSYLLYHDNTPLCTNRQGIVGGDGKGEWGWGHKCQALLALLLLFYVKSEFGFCSIFLSNIFASYYLTHSLPAHALYTEYIE